jgi:hypothetical protein
MGGKANIKRFLSKPMKLNISIISIKTLITSQQPSAILTSRNMRDIAPNFNNSLTNKNRPVLLSSESSISSSEIGSSPLSLH